MSGFANEYGRPTAATQRYFRAKYVPPAYARSPVEVTTVRNQRVMARGNYTTGLTSQTCVGARWTEMEEWQNTYASATTATTSTMVLNQISSPLYGGGSEVLQLAGSNFRKNPNGIQYQEQYAKYARVRTVELKIHVMAGITQGLKAALKVWRSDLPEPAFESSLTTPQDPKNSAGVIFWDFHTFAPSEPKSNAAFNQRYKTVRFNIPQFFNDVEWHLDNPGTDAGAPNFWVTKDASNTFCAEPNLKLYAKLYLQYMWPDDDTSSTAVWPMYEMTQTIEFRRGTENPPNPASL